MGKRTSWLALAYTRLSTYMSLYWVFCEAYHGKLSSSSLLFFFWPVRVTTVNVLTNHQDRISLPSTTSKRKGVQVKLKYVCKSNGVKRWRKKVRTYYVTIISAQNSWTSTFSSAFFNHFPLEVFCQTNGNWLVGAPRAHFRQKLSQNWQIAWASPLTVFIKQASLFFLPSSRCQNCEKSLIERHNARREKGSNQHILFSLFTRFK